MALAVEVKVNSTTNTGYQALILFQFLLARTLEVS
jgi:hypothetical protein